MSPASYQAAPPRADGSLSAFRFRSSAASAASDQMSRRFSSASESGKRDSNPRPQPWQGCALPTELFPRSRPDRRKDGGERDRTADLVNAIHALSQLSYAPVIFGRPQAPPRWEHGNLAGGFRSVKQIPGLCEHTQQPRCMSPCQRNFEPRSTWNQGSQHYTREGHGPGT